MKKEVREALVSNPVDPADLVNPVETVVVYCCRRAARRCQYSSVPIAPKVQTPKSASSARSAVLPCRASTHERMLGGRFEPLAAARISRTAITP